MQSPELLTVILRESRKSHRFILNILESTTRHIEIPLSKKKLVLMLVGSIAFVLLGLWLFSEADNLTGWRARNPAFVRGVSVAGVLFFGLCSIYIAPKLADKKPGLIINSVGLTDNSSGVAAGLILWSDIIKISVIDIRRQKLIMLHVKNPQDYIDRQSSGLKRKLMQMNFNMYGTPLSISSNSLKIKFDELFDILSDKLSSSRQ